MEKPLQVELQSCIYSEWAHNNIAQIQVLFGLLVNFVANKCTLFILFLYVTLQVCRHASIRVHHHRGISYMNIFKLLLYVHISLYNSLWLKHVLSVLCI
jgi:hypothetical protein